MKTSNFGLFFLIISSFCLKCFCYIKVVSFLPNSNIITTETPQRDGIVLVTLSTNENTTICNYNFNEISASIVCKTLGFPANGITIVNNAKTPLTSPVLLANFNCNGSEQNLTFCFNSGRSVQSPPCSDHTMDVHVYCLLKKEAPIVILDTATVCNRTDSEYSFINKSSLQNTGFLQVFISQISYSVCNDDYSFGSDAAQFVCERLCTSPNNPTIIMPYFKFLSNSDSVKISCSSSKNCTTKVSGCFKPAYFVGLKCGDEPQTLEKPPNIFCTDQNMLLIWPYNFTPYINSSLVNLLQPCNTVIKNNSLGDASMLIPFNNCTPVVSGDPNNVIFSYTVLREYLFNNIVQQLPRTVTFSCYFPKGNNANDSIKIDGVTKTQMNASFNLGVKMNFYSDRGLTTEVLANGQINSDVLLYVKVYIINPPKNVSLHLTECSVATVNESPLLSTSGNSVFLIHNSCPESLYDVIISPLSRTEIKFQFSPFKTLSTPSIKLNVHCKTSLCYLIQDSNCPFCGNRRKRSANFYLKNFEVGRSFYLVEKK